ncbi:MAG TPA: hypothetical protein DEO84_11710 [candidate division Zixibacteria bacterium]|nr:hypothetical protein [candidate division Zixibacteria bacterium]HBZ01973.1 hypothetical protein [candidate division Zixibacteria bacterium]
MKYHSTCGLFDRSYLQFWIAKIIALSLRDRIDRRNLNLFPKLLTNKRLLMASAHIGLSTKVME